MKHVFIGGETGYIGRALIPRLVAHGHSLTALARKGSEHKIPPGCTIQIGNALDRHYIRCARLRYFIHLVGTPHPAPGRASSSVGGPAFLVLVRKLGCSGRCSTFHLPQRRSTRAGHARVYPGTCRVRANYLRRRLTRHCRPALVRSGSRSLVARVLQPVEWLVARIGTVRDSAQRSGSCGWIRYSHAGLGGRASGKD